MAVILPEDAKTYIDEIRLRVGDRGDTVVLVGYLFSAGEPVENVSVESDGIYVDGSPVVLFSNATTVSALRSALEQSNTPLRLQPLSVALLTDTFGFAPQSWDTIVEQEPLYRAYLLSDVEIYRIAYSVLRAVFKYHDWSEIDPDVREAFIAKACEQVCITIAAQAGKFPASNLDGVGISSDNVASNFMQLAQVFRQEYRTTLVGAGIQIRSLSQQERVIRVARDEVSRYPFDDFGVDCHAEVDGATVKLTWERYEGDYFYKYLVYRDDTKLAEITDKLTLEYEDTVTAGSYTYRVDVALTVSKLTLDGAVERYVVRGYPVTVIVEG